MTTTRPPANVPIGSSLWIQNENDQLSQFLSQEAEDFGFAARNEVEWLNEHMADIFTKNLVYELLAAREFSKANVVVEMSQKYSKPLESFGVRHREQRGSTMHSRIDRFAIHSMWERTLTNLLLSR